MSTRKQYLSRPDALFSGNPTYYTGIHCKYGHLSYRRTSSRECIECHRIRQQKNFDVDLKRLDKVLDCRILLWKLEYIKYRYG